MLARDTVKEPVRQREEGLNPVLTHGRAVTRARCRTTGSRARNVATALHALRPGENTSHWSVAACEPARAGGIADLAHERSLSSAMGPYGALERDPVPPDPRGSPSSTAPRRRPRTLTEQKRAAWCSSVTRDTAVSRDLSTCAPSCRSPGCGSMRSSGRLIGDQTLRPDLHRFEALAESVGMTHVLIRRLAYCCGQRSAPIGAASGYHLRSVTRRALLWVIELS